MLGSKVLTCLTNKTWSDAPPTCTKIGCSLPANITHGFVRFSTTDYQSNLEYFCETGYTMVGMRTRSCLRSSQWSGEAPKCLPSLCPTLGKFGTLENFLYYYNKDINHIFLTINTFIRYPKWLGKD